MKFYCLRYFERELVGRRWLVRVDATAVRKSLGVMRKPLGARRSDKVA